MINEYLCKQLSFARQCITKLSPFYIFDTLANLLKKQQLHKLMFYMNFVFLKILAQQLLCILQSREDGVLNKQNNNPLHIFTLLKRNYHEKHA